MGPEPVLGEAATRFVDDMQAQARITAVAAFGPDAVVLRVDALEGQDFLVPSLECHRRGDDGSWRPAWSVSGAFQALTVPDGFVYVRRGTDGRQVVAHRASGDDGSPAMSERVLDVRPGMLGSLTLRPGTDTLVYTMEGPAAPGEHRRDVLRDSDAVWWDGPEASLAGARRPVGDWQVWQLGLDGAGESRRIEVTVPAGTALTGEAACLASAMVLGTSVYRPDGSRRFGLLLVPADGSATRHLLHDAFDLTAPLQSPDGGTVACLAVSLPTGDEAPAQYAALVDARSLEPRILKAPDDTWQQPCGWDGSDRLVCKGADGPRHVLYTHDLRTAGWTRTEASASVVHARVAAGQAAAVVAAMGTPPALEVVDLASAVREPVRTTRLDLPRGRVTYHPQRLPDVPGALASWLCLPEDEPVRGTVVLLHGGPVRNWAEWHWRWNPWPFVACGFAVILVEPPMSLGYVSAMSAGWRRWRTGVAAAAVGQVRQLLEETGLSGSPLAVVGPCVGGLLALSAAQELRPRLVVSYGGTMDQAQIAGGGDGGWLWTGEFGSPDSEQDSYAAESLQPHSVPSGTRVLLSHGLQDGWVPPTESLRVHRALLRDGVRSELVLFRTEGHQLARPRNVRAWYRWTLTACLDELGAARIPEEPR
ncbi:alpha/beta hydrolase family protein [Streptomyces pseudovenezuelae]|uniref:alpha/beta hydrolase family protein n=1 Tax=Streptomyces pseudovenezuelae TaxID=67350 RepID=UPI002E812F31|nr:prolyl oligopeptidase family serine peptidase [Streptomyces pseudovenezuelae]WUA85913.1 prolyl oligopeptidase family serine peptidase [Streptomyces pseudovenezuelae]